MPVYHGRAKGTESFLCSKRSPITRFEDPSHSHHLPDSLSESREVEEVQLEDVELQMYDGTDVSGVQSTATFRQNTDEVDSMSEASVRSPCDTQTFPDVCQTNGPSRSSETCFGLVGYEPFMISLLAKVSTTDMRG